MDGDPTQGGACPLCRRELEWDTLVENMRRRKNVHGLRALAPATNRCNGCPTTQRTEFSG
jgi:hypothetical protein